MFQYEAVLIQYFFAKLSFFFLFFLVKYLYVRFKMHFVFCDFLFFCVFRVNICYLRFASFFYKGKYAKTKFFRFVFILDQFLNIIFCIIPFVYRRFNSIRTTICNCIGRRYSYVLTFDVFTFEISSALFIVFSFFGVTRQDALLLS